MLLDERKIRDHFSGSPVLDFRSFLRESVFYAIGKCVLGHKKRSAGIAMRRKGIMPQAEKPAIRLLSCAAWKTGENTRKNVIVENVGCST